MKKILLLTFSLLVFAGAKAQISDHAIGLRFGWGGGLSYQMKLDKNNRLELNGAMNFGGAYSTLRLTGAYHWVFQMSGPWQFYVGPAASAGSLKLENNYAGKGDNGLFVSIGGQIGVDYTFENVPILLSVDVLPMISVVNNYDDIYLDPAFGIRYVF